jgi:polar amino acid transport system permease protein
MNGRGLWDWGFAWEILHTRLIPVLGVTVLATLGGMAIALVLGLAVTLMRRSRNKIISRTAGFIVEFVRSTPLLIQIYFVFYALPQILPFLGDGRLSPMATGIVALGVHYSSYTSEVYRAGIENISRGQWESATVLGFGARDTWLRIILPQAIPPIVPALGNYLVAMFKDTPMLSTITVLELLYTAKDIGSESFRYNEAFTLVGVLFLLVSLLSAAAIRFTERKLALPR